MTSLPQGLWWHAFRWTAAAGMEDLGTLSDASVAVAINDNGVVTGHSGTADGHGHSFVWTRAGGMVDIGTLGGGTESFPVAVGPLGEAIGYSIATLPPDYYQRAYRWTAAGGMRDLGALSGVESYPLAVSKKSHIVGVVDWSDQSQHGFSWTVQRGMVDLGSLAGGNSAALHVNIQDQIVGDAVDQDGNPRAVIWAPGQAIADLNKRLVNAPAGMVIEVATGIADNGVIVAESNAGTVVLRPLGEAIIDAPVVGPIAAPALGRVGSAIASKLAFTDANPSDLHHVS